MVDAYGGGGISSGGYLWRGRWALGLSLVAQPAATASSAHRPARAKQRQPRGNLSSPRGINRVFLNA